MKKYLVLGIIGLIAVSPLCKGLFFPLERYTFFCLLAVLSLTYILLKLAKHETILQGIWTAKLKYFPLLFNLLLISACLLSFSRSVYPRGNWDELIQDMLYMIIFIVIYDYFLDNIRQVKRYIFIPFALSGFVVAFLGLLTYSGTIKYIPDTIFNGRLASTLQYSNTTAIYLLVSFVLTAVLLILQENIIRKVILAGMGNIISLALFFTGSRGVLVILPFIICLVFVLLVPKDCRLKSICYLVSMIFPLIFAIKGYGTAIREANAIWALVWILLSALAASLLTFAYCKAEDRLSTTLPSYVMFILACLFPLIFISSLYIGYGEQVSTIFKEVLAKVVPETIMNRLLHINMTTSSVVGRIQMDQDAFKIAKDYWLTGTGGGGWAALYQKEQSAFYISRLVHNHYLQIFVEAGLLGLISFIGLIIATIVNYWYALSRVKSVQNKLLLAGLISAFLTLAVHAAMDIDLSYSGMALVFWCLMGLAAAYYHYKKGTSKRRRAGVELGKELSRRNNQLVAGTVVLIILIALGLSTLAIRPAYSAWQGTKSQAEGEPLQAIAYYSKALELDPENAEYHAALADLYKWMAYTSKTEAEKGQWLQKGILAINEASRYSPYTPEYQYRKAEIYFTAEEWVKAWEATEQLIKVQPLRKENYELLARGYLEAGLQFLRERDLAKGQELLEKCAQIDRLPPVKGSTTLYYYQGKALLLLGEYQRSETLLKRARNGSLSLRMNSDRLLYIINEKTGRQAENAKYKGILWMGAATQTDEYKEIHEILDSDMLKTAKNM